MLMVKPLNQDFEGTEPMMFLRGRMEVWKTVVDAVEEGGERVGRGRRRRVRRRQKMRRERRAVVEV